MVSGNDTTAVQVESQSVPSLIDVSPDTQKPAADAEVKNPADSPADGADAQKTETPEQQAEKRESRRARARARDAAALASAQTEARLLREQLEKRDAQQRQQQATGEPKREDFDDYESYQRAINKFDAAQVTEERLKKEREERQGQEQKHQATETQRKQADDWDKREVEFSAAVNDYQEKADDFVENEIGKFSQSAREAIVELGPAMLYFLADNSEVAEGITKLSPLAQVRELGRLEEKLPKPAETKRASDAPAPAKPGSQGRSTPSKDPEKMPMEDYMAFRKQGGARWAR